MSVEREVLLAVGGGASDSGARARSAHHALGGTVRQDARRNGKTSAEEGLRTSRENVSAKVGLKRVHLE